MKYSLLILTTLMSLQTYATGIGLTSVALVVDYSSYDNTEDEKRFGIQNVPVNGCYGFIQGPQLSQFTAPYEIEASVGCGFPTGEKTNINALTCAKVVDSVELETTGVYKKIVLDISACEAKDDPQFITMVRTAAARNFPQPKDSKQKQLELVLNK